MKTKQELKQYFKNGDIPNQEQFWEWQDSYWHKSEKILIDKVENLQATLDKKVNTPSGTGFYFLTQNGEKTTFQKIDLRSYYLLWWNGSNFSESNIYYQNDKVGIGTSSLTETFEVNGNIKTAGLIVTNLSQEQDNTAFTKNIVAKSDGTFGWEDKAINSLISYSVREQMTGNKWINNKPIYRKTIIITSIPSNGEINIQDFFQDLDIIVSNKMFTEWDSMGTAFAGNQWEGQFFITIQPHKVKMTNIKNQDYNYSDITSFTLTLDYTKKTDQ